MDSNRGPLEFQAIALPTEPQPLPNFVGFFSVINEIMSTVVKQC